MDEARRKRLEAAGWVFGDHGDFLGLTDAERQHVELRIALARAIRQLRESKGLTQKAVGKLIESTQSRVAKVEMGTVEVSLDLMFRAFFAIGGRMEDLTVRPAPGAKSEEAPAVEPKPRPRKRLSRQGG
jgi:predicted XRE-type DNA-binding protein